MSFSSPYAVLGITHGASEIDVKKAYRKALLQYHPDKITQLSAGTAGEVHPNLTIDDINLAYQRIKENQHAVITGRENSETVIFNETVDLADLDQSELPDGSLQWTRPCRCSGDGYLLLERDLELNGDADEIAVQCAGCSIFILVQYAIE